MNYDGNMYMFEPATSTTAFLATTTYTGFASKAAFPSGRNHQNLTSSSAGVYAYGTLNTSSAATTGNVRWTTNSWTTLTSLPVAIAHVGQAAGNGYALCVGGALASDGQSNPQSTNYIYNESGNSWSTGTNYPTAKSNMLGAYVNTGSTGVTANRYYLSNGFLTGFGQNSNAYSYTIATNAWRAEISAPTGNAYGNFGWTGTTTNANNYLFTNGGDNGATNQRSSYLAQVI
jgi:hypothetical protein